MLSTDRYAGAIKSVKYFGDEQDWVNRTYFARLVFIDGNTSHSRWSEIDGIDHPHVAEFLIAAAFATVGDEVAHVPEFNILKHNYSNHPTGQRLLTARLPSAISGALTSILVYAIGLAATNRIFIGAAAGLSYAYHPLALESAARAMSDGPLVFFSCASILFATCAMPATRTPAPPPAFTVSRVIYLGLASASAGLATATKLTGLVVACAIAASFATVATMLVFRYRRAALGWVAWAAIGVVGIVAVGMLANPTLHHEPVKRFRAMVHHRLKTSKIQMDTWSNVRLDHASDRYAAAGGYLAWEYPPYEESSWPFVRVWLAPLGAGIVVWNLVRSGARWKLVPLVAGSLTAAFILIPNQPMDWARYFLPAVPYWELLCAVGLAGILSSILQLCGAHANASKLVNFGGEQHD